MLEAIGKECFKHIKTHGRTLMNTSLLRSCTKALRCMHEINTYINRYKKDTEYMVSVRSICDRIRNMKSTKGLESQYGQLVFEGQMKFKRSYEDRYNDMCHLMCFQARILIFDIEHSSKKALDFDSLSNTTRTYKQ